jgi:hypothetical protein
MEIIGTIMCDRSEIMRARQMAVRREMDRRRLLLKTVAADSGLSLSTLASHFPLDGTPAVMSVATLFQLLETRALPTDLAAWLLPGGLDIVEVPDGVDHDNLAAACTQYLTQYAAARHPAGEAGIAIGPREAGDLTGAAVRLRSVVA